MEAADVWKILLGAVVALAGTLLAQWSSLAYQTRRQREARRADFQRTTLLQLREMLGELDDAMLRLFLARQEALDRTGDWKMLAAHHPDLEAVGYVTGRLMLHTTAVEHEGLRGLVASLALSAVNTAAAPSRQEAVAQRKATSLVRTKVIMSLGDQLRSLP
jgi:hypothetical protein